MKTIRETVAPIMVTTVSLFPVLVRSDETNGNILRQFPRTVVPVIAQSLDKKQLISASRILAPGLL
jgi:hypothetical protein